MTEHRSIDAGKPFDWGRASRDYARYRDIYPQEFYQRILDAGLCTMGQTVLDLGTGTGVLPRNLCPYGARFTGIDSAEHQIEQARILSADAGMEIDYLCGRVEDVDFPEASFDTVTACQCFFYFDHETLAPRLHRLLKRDGRLAVLYMAWLPYEDAVAGASEALVLKYNPSWSGCGETRHEIAIPDCYGPYFSVEQSQVFDLRVPFTRESWNGRMKACRGIGASLSSEEVERFGREHLKVLSAAAPETFEVLHYAAITVLRVK